MCAEYEIRTSDKQIEAILERSLINVSERESWDDHIKLTNRVPVVEMSAQGLVLRERVFPVQPFPNSRLSSAGMMEEQETPKPDRTEESPQIRRVYELPTWGQGFREERCLAAMTAFLEPAYWGPDAGAVMQFRVPGEKVFFVAAIGIKSKLPKSPERNAVSLLTHVATAQMFAYHHRLVVVLRPADALKYLEYEPETPAYEIFEHLLRSRYTGPFEVQKARQMAKGWDKRIAAHQHKLLLEKRYVQALEDEGIKG